MHQSATLLLINLSIGLKARPHGRARPFPGFYPFTLMKITTGIFYWRVIPISNICFSPATLGSHALASFLSPKTMTGLNVYNCVKGKACQVQLESVDAA